LGSTRWPYLCVWPRTSSVTSTLRCTRSVPHTRPHHHQLPARQHALAVHVRLAED
jgi:hypothetical protein